MHEEYKEFLASRGRTDKAYGTINHDAAVLDAVRHQRTTSKSTLRAGALLVTCDYLLYRFDWESARKGGHLPSVVLPNVLWQILRPYIQDDAAFDRSFAETFALPEFRAVASGGSKACSKMLSILVAYDDVPEETALSLMSNGVLLDQLRTIESDKEFEERVEAALS